LTCRIGESNDEGRNTEKLMDSEQSTLVKFAANVAASGRWDAVNKRIEILAKNPGKDNDWWVQTIGCLCSHVFSEYLLLKNAYEEWQRGGASLLAWRARNLLELSVWALYCAKSRAHARHFYEDAGRDVFGLFSAFTKWGTATAQPPEWLDIFTGLKKDLTSRAAADGIASLDDAYKRVHEAAREVGLEENHALAYKMLSKFAHPTAMQIMGAPDEKREAKQRDWFFSQGCLFFTGAFEALEGQVK
jgi:hypothetical protein